MPPSFHHHQKTSTMATATQVKLFPRKKPIIFFSTKPSSYRRVLWLALCLYLLFFFFSSSHFHLFPISKTTTLPTTTSSLPSRALIETVTSKPTNHFSPPTTSTTTNGDPLSLRIYVYDLPARYNSDWLTNTRCSNHLFASEVAIHEAILSSPIHTTDQSEADFFFVPVYVACNFSTINGFPSLTHARPLLSSAVQHISNHFPFWSRSGGSDHIFVVSHDFGACFHAMEDVAVADGIPSFLSNSILLQTFGVKHSHVCQDVEHVLIPPYIPAEEILDRWSSPEKSKRDIFAYFRGKMEVHPKNISGRFYSKKVRTEIWRRYGDHNPKFYVKRKRFDGFRSEIARSVFCLCPRGWAPWSPRLVESVVLGCVPVIIADGIRLPFPESIPWNNISLTVGEHHVGELENVLENVARTNLSRIQRNLWDPKVRKALLFYRRMREGDATWHVLRDISGKIDRSWRRG